jgi:regulator of protease activity HflC (stomatin/prohibitin superfamily)
MSKASGEGRRAESDDSLWSPTQEGLQVGIDITVWHHLDPLRVVDIHQKIGPDYEEKIIRPAVRSVIRMVISEYGVMEVYSAKRALIQDEINAKLKALVEKDGFVIDEVVLRDVRFTDEFTKAIEAKQIAQQSAEQMKYVLEKEQREAARKVIEATGRAKAIETINEALRQNPNYIRYLYVDKLSDKISVIVSDQNTIMDLKGSSTAGRSETVTRRRSHDRRCEAGARSVARRRQNRPRLAPHLERARRAPVPGASRAQGTTIYPGGVLPPAPDVGSEGNETEIP